MGQWRWKMGEKRLGGQSLPVVEVLPLASTLLPGEPNCCWGILSFLELSLGFQFTAFTRYNYKIYSAVSPFLGKSY
jgi:hypothetical protein